MTAYLGANVSCHKEKPRKLCICRVVDVDVDKYPTLDMRYFDISPRGTKYSSHVGELNGLKMLLMSFHMAQSIFSDS